MTIVKVQRGITTKLYRQELGLLYSACRLIMLYISMKFHEGFSSYRADTKWPLSNFKGESLHNWLDKSCGSCVLHVVWWCFVYLWSFMMLSWAVFKFYTADTNNSKKCTDKSYGSCGLHAIWWCFIFYEVSWKYLERFSSYRADTIAWRTDRQTDRRTDNRGKHNMSPSLSRGDITIKASH